MDVLLMIVYSVIVLGVLVFIHEAGHYLAARAFGVRVTEFMLGLPGPNIGITRGETKFGVTPILLGGYARVCGMEPGEMSPHLKSVLAAMYKRGTANMEDIAFDCNISNDEAYAALEELTEWGSLAGPLKTDEFNTYRTRAFTPTKRAFKKAQKKGLPPLQSFELGEPRPFESADELFDHEYAQQYRSLPFWKRSVILVAGVAVNLLFAMAIFVVLFSFIGYDVQNSETGAITHVVLAPWQSIQLGFNYIFMVAQMIAGLFNPQTAATTVSNSSSIIGIAVMSKTVFDQGLVQVLQFFAMISVSLGIMNLLPIPPLDGGRFVVEVYQKITRRVVSVKAMNTLSTVGVALFVGFFLLMANQDVQRIISGAGFGA